MEKVPLPDRPSQYAALTEIRIHGVGGTRPEEMLSDISPKLVSGDTTAGFYRTSDDGSRQIEAYSWGGLTSRSPLRVLWTVLMPAMLANMAGWMARPGGPQKSKFRQELESVVYRWFGRLAALALTLNTAIVVTMLSLDTFAYQCLGQYQCSNQLVGLNWLTGLNFLFERPGLRLAIGVIGPISVVLLFFFLAGRSRARYESVEPPTVGAMLPKPEVRCAAAQEGGLSSPEFWSGWLWHKHLSDLHLAASIAVVSGTVGWCVLEIGSALSVTVFEYLPVAWIATLGAVAVSLVVIFMLFWDEAHPYYARLTLVISVVFLLLSVAAALMLPPTDAKQTGVAPGVEGITQVWWIVLILLVPLICQQVMVWFLRWGKAWRDAQNGTEYNGLRDRIKGVRSKARGTREVFPFAAPVVLNAIALILSNAILLSMTIVVAEGLGDVRYGFGRESGGAPLMQDVDTDVVLWVPKIMVSVASALVIFLVYGLVLFAVGLWVSVAVTSKMMAPLTMEQLRHSYQQQPEYTALKAQDAQVQARLNLWKVSAFDVPVHHGDRRKFVRSSDVSAPNKWVRKTTRAEIIADCLPTLAAFFVIMVAMLGLVGAVLVFLQWWDPHSRTVNLVTWLSLLFPPAYMALVWTMFRNERIRKALMTPFDVGTFFPRSFHPFAPPSYTERAVPELTRRIWWLQDAGDRVVLNAHSQGSAIAAAVLARQSKRDNNPIGIITFGCPLKKLYGWAFPALFSDELFESIRIGLGGFGAVHWRNVYYKTDYIGGSLATETQRQFEEIDIQLVDPMTDQFVFGQPLPRILSHTGYWVDARFWAEVDAVCRAFTMDRWQRDYKFKGAGPSASPEMLAPAVTAFPDVFLSLALPRRCLPPRGLNDNKKGSVNPSPKTPDPATPVTYR